MLSGLKMWNPTCPLDKHLPGQGLPIEYVMRIVADLTEESGGP